MVKSRKRINPRRKTPRAKTLRSRPNRTDLTTRNLPPVHRRLDALSMELDALAARVRNLEQAQPTPAPETGTLL